MNRFTFAPPPVISLPVADEDRRCPVRRVYCVGRNYAAHTVEMGGDPDREPPFFFQKNPDNLDPSGDFPYPARSEDVHHEVELAVILAAGGVEIPVERALDLVFGYAVAIDMTRRDLQAEQKRLRRPWEISKAFERSAPVGPVHPAASIGHLAAGRIALRVNGELRQEGDLGQMIWKVPEMIACLSRYVALAAGDVILTGTPAGVAAVARGDVMQASVDGLRTLTVQTV